MAQRRVGTVVYREDLSPHLLIIRLMPEAGTTFPTSKAGQYITLSSDNCRLTKKLGVRPDGKAIHGPALDESGQQKTGTVTHSYSLSSAPEEQETHGYLEFYLTLETLRGGGYGRLSSALARLDPAGRERTLGYVDRIAGTFTLEDRTTGYSHVLMVGSGTSLAPFVAMIKQLHHDAQSGRGDGQRYTLLHTNRTFEELGYHETLVDIERAQNFDFVYIPTVSRPTDHDRRNPGVGIGRANNVLRYMLGLLTKEQEALAASLGRDGDPGEAEEAFRRTVKPELPAHLSVGGLADRLDAKTTKILACGNPVSLTDIRQTAERCGFAFDMEEWQRFARLTPSYPIPSIACLTSALSGRTEMS